MLPEPLAKILTIHALTIHELICVLLLVSV